MMEVHISHEEGRGCGFRKPGKDGVGIYLMGEGIFEACERLPFPLVICPCCGAGIKFSRGYTWIDPTRLFAPGIEPACHANLRGDNHRHNSCAVCNPSVAGQQAGLMWVGESHYTPKSFTKEAMTRGVSKKLSAVPRGLKIGEHYIYLAHIKAVVEFDGVALNGNGPEFTPGVFMVFKPTHIDLVIDDENDIPERAQYIADALGDNARLVKVVPVKNEQRALLEV